MSSGITNDLINEINAELKKTDPDTDWIKVRDNRFYDATNNNIDTNKLTTEQKLRVKTTVELNNEKKKLKKYLSDIENLNNTNSTKTFGFITNLFSSKQKDTKSQNQNDIKVLIDDLKVKLIKRIGEYDNAEKQQKQQTAGKRRKNFQKRKSNRTKKGGNKRKLKISRKSR